MDETRRRFCQAGSGLLLATALAPGCGGNDGGGDMGGSTLVLAGTTAQLPMGQILALQVDRNNINVCHDAGGFFAVEGNCTHANCVLLFADQSNPSGFTCPCHMSTFDYNGQNPTGPAAQTGALKHFKVVLMGTQIYVDTATNVDISVRVM